MSSHIDSTTGAVFEQGPRSLRAVGHEARSSLSLVSRYNSFMLTHVCLLCLTHETQI